jgi:cleavage and polyadenylation specificity factor subunit 4
MEDADGGLSFDFEGGLEAAGPAGGAPQGAGVPGQQAAAVSNSVQAPSSAAAPKNQQARKNYRQTVCRHWLRGLCMKGDACGFLHQFDKARMPVCRFFAKFGECREPDCIYKHTNEDIKECNMYVFSSGSG